MGRRDLPGFTLARALRSGESEFFERDLAPGEDERRLLAVVERGEGPALPRKVCVGVNLSGPQEVRNLALGGQHPRRALLGDHRGLLRGDGPDGLTQLERVEGGERVRRGHLNLEGEVEAPLRLCEPAPAPVGEGRVPLVPEAARRVAYLRAPRQLEGDAQIDAAQAHFERRAGLDDVGDSA